MLMTSVTVRDRQLWALRPVDVCRAKYQDARLTREVEPGHWRKTERVLISCHPGMWTFTCLFVSLLLSGGDQGLLNSFFSSWPTADISKHLPFVYNLSVSSLYSYLPAFKRWVSLRLLLLVYVELNSFAHFCICGWRFNSFRLMKDFSFPLFHSIGLAEGPADADTGRVA